MQLYHQRDISNICPVKLAFIRVLTESNIGPDNFLNCRPSAVTPRNPDIPWAVLAQEDGTSNPCFYINEH